MSIDAAELETMTGEPPAAEPDRIALRSTLAAIELPDFPSYDSSVELPRHSMNDSTSKTAMPPKPAERIKSDAPVQRLEAPAADESAQQPKDVDVAYFPTRAMLPELTVLSLISAGWIMFAMPVMPAFLQSWEVYVSIPGAYGLFVFVRWLFRVISGGYRLTREQLLRVNAGPIPDPDPIALGEIASVQSEASIMEMCLGVGKVKIKFVRDAQPEIVLGPVSWPRRRAALLNEAIELAREGSVVGLRKSA